MNKKETIISLIREFYPFAKDKLSFKEPVKLFVKNDASNAKDGLGKTAYYEPQSKSISIYITDRHPKDVLRSFSHELVHHTQNCSGQFNETREFGENYIMEDEHLREMEREAYEKGNLILREFEANQDKNKFKMETTKMSTKAKLFESRNRLMGKAILVKFGLSEAYEYDDISKDAQSGGVHIPEELAEPLHRWHSGMGDPIYKVGSLAANSDPVPTELAMEAKEELERLYDAVEDENDKMELDEIIAELGRILTTQAQPLAEEESQT